MENLKGFLREVIDRSREAEAALDREYEGLGGELLDQGLERSGSTQLKQLHGSAAETRDFVRKNEATSDRLTKLLGQLAETKEAIEEKRGELDVLAEEIEPHFEKVGRATVEALIDYDEEALPYRKVIDQLRSLESEMKQLNRELGQGGMEEEGRGIVTLALSSGKKLYLQGVLRTKVLRTTSLYRKLGREVCETDLITRVDSRAFIEVLEPVAKNREQVKKIEAQISSLRNKTERLQNEINSLSENDRPQRRLQRLESERQERRDRLSVQLRELGLYFADHSGNLSSMDKRLKSQLDAVKSRRKEMESLASVRKRVEAAIAVVELERRIDTERTKVRNLETTVRKANNEIAERTAEIKGFNEEREKLLKVRGELEDLKIETAEAG